MSSTSAPRITRATAGGRVHLYGGARVPGLLIALLVLVMALCQGPLGADDAANPTTKLPAGGDPTSTAPGSTTPTSDKPVPADGTNGTKTDADENGIQPLLVSRESGQGFLSLKPGAKNYERKGARFRYEHVKVLCDHVDYWLSMVAGAKNEVLDHAFLYSGPDAVTFCAPDVPDDHHLVFDSRESRLPKVGFRGLMEPFSADIKRQEPDPQKPKIVHFRILLHRLDDFAGDLRTTQGWKPFAGYADEAQIMMVADITPSGLANERFESVVLLGRPFKDGVEKKNARFERLKLPTPPGLPMRLLHDREKNWYITGPTITILFDEDGKVESLVNDNESMVVGTPSEDIGSAHPSTPAIDPGH